MKFFIVILSFVVIASAKPQGSRFDVDDDSSDDIAVIPTRGNQADPLSALLRGLSQSTSSRQFGGFPGQLGGGGFSGPRRPQDTISGPVSGVVRLLLNLLGSELGLENLNSQLFDGVDEEALLRNLIRTFTNIVGNVILR